MSRSRSALAAAAAASTLLLTAACGGDSGGNSNGAGGDAPTSFTAGEYEAEGGYQSPGGPQRVEVELTLEADGTITDLDVDGQAESGDSVQFQGKFESGIAEQVVGRKITELDVDKVSGSSLTSGGFNAAIEDIVGQARA